MLVNGQMFITATLLKVIYIWIDTGVRKTLERRYLSLIHNSHINYNPPKFNVIQQTLTHSFLRNDMYAESDHCLLYFFLKTKQTK